MKTLVYSPRQVAFSAFFGGPLAAVYVLSKNYQALGKKRHAKATIIAGGFLTIFLLGILPFLPEKFPHTLIPIAYVVSATQVAEQLQMSKQAITGSEQYGFRSNYNILGVCAGWLSIFLVIWVIEVVLLVELGMLT